MRHLLRSRANDPRQASGISAPVYLLVPAFALAAVCACGDESGGSNNEGDVGVDSGEDASEPDTGDIDSAEIDTSPEEDTGPVVECFDDLEAGEFEVFYDGFPRGFDGGSEGITFGADGRLYVSSQDTVYAFDAEGTRSEFASVPHALGLAPYAEGIWVASIGESSAPEVIDGAVYRVPFSGEAELVVDDIASPNFVTLMPTGDVLVSDDFDTRVFRVSPDGSTSVAIDGIESPNGMAYTPDGRGLVVASTFTDRGQITVIPVDDDGVPSADGWEEIAEVGAGSTPDGVAIDAMGNVYVAANLQSRIVRVAPDGTMDDLATGVGSVASLAFGNGEGFDPCSIYMTQLFGTKVLRVAVGVPGLPLP